MIRFKSEASAWTPSAVQLQQVWTDPEARGQGYATRALQDLCRLLLERVPTVCLFVRPENAPALALYERIGMERTHTYLPAQRGGTHGSPRAPFSAWLIRAGWPPGG